MTAKLTASLRAAPATVPALAAVPLFVVWATDQAGYPVTHWGAGGLTCVVPTADGLAGVCGTDAGTLVVFDVDD